MYAVIKTGGKQYQVSAGEAIQVELLDGDPGDQVDLNEVLLINDGSNLTLGRPYIQGASVSAEIVDHGKHSKVLIFKYRRRKRFRRKNGHRQPYTTLRIKDIQGAMGSAEASVE